MQSSGDHGVVLISFGSAIMHLDEKIINSIIAAVAQLKQKVIWKIKGKQYFHAFVCERHLNYLQKPSECPLTGSNSLLP